MTQDDTAPQDRPERDDRPVTGDVTDRTAQPRESEPTVTPEQDDPDREGADRFDAG